ncbi:Abi family protein [Lichenibacterium minor]|uniref:Abi family protein n=1 Tax=Lichenibacterium minor TaxID=2316528 RepID=A0A4Q2U0E2_9HYPH|nr:Abi family protein [Lichenibacterium minor]RYC29098.1 Abi family protein [Lichenibacterium minor]
MSVAVGRIAEISGLTPSDNVASFSKPALPADQIVYRLWSNGLVISDQAQAVSAIKSIGYYRLLIYMRHFQGANKKFYAGTKFSEILDLYNFDRNLRLVLLDAIEKLEVALRAAISNEMSIAHGPHWYMHRVMFTDFSYFIKTQSKIISEVGSEQKTRWIALSHYYATYNDPSLPPSWVVFERLTFGTLSRIFEALTTSNRKMIAKALGFDEQILTSWLHSLTYIRNTCAHHGQIWNVRLPKFIPKALKRFKSEFLIDNELYTRMLVMWLLLKNVEHKSDFRDHLNDLFSKYPNCSPAKLGFPTGWMANAAWQ